MKDKYWPSAAFPFHFELQTSLSYPGFKMSQNDKIKNATALSRHQNLFN